MSGRARTLAPLAGFALLTAAVMLLPAWISDFRAQEFAYVGMYTVALIGLNMLTGYTGQISLGHGAFMAIGGYTTALLMAGNEQFGQTGIFAIGGGMKDIWTIPIAGLVAGLVGFLFGFPALRLSGLYLALATFAIAVAMPAVIKNFEQFTGGGSGINLFGLPELTASISPVERAGVELNFNNYLYYLSWSTALILYVAAWLFLRGRTGTGATRRARQRDGGRLVGSEPGALQDARLRRERRLRGRRGLAVRDRDHVRQPRCLPDRALHHPARRCRGRRARLAARPDRRRRLHPVHANRVAPMRTSGFRTGCRCWATSIPVLPARRQWSTA